LAGWTYVGAGLFGTATLLGVRSVLEAGADSFALEAVVLVCIEALEAGACIGALVELALVHIGASVGQA